MDEYQNQENNANGYQSPYGNVNGYQQPNTPNGYQQANTPNGYQQPYAPNGYQQPNTPNGYQAPVNGANGYQQPYNPNGYQPPVNGANGYPQPYDMNGYRSFDDAMNSNQVVNSGDMPNAGLYLFLLIVGFLCGILWGLLSLGPYKRMKAAIEANDSVEAKKNANKILIFAIIGVVLNVMVLIGNLAQSGAF